MGFSKSSEQQGASIEREGDVVVIRNVSRAARRRESWRTSGPTGPVKRMTLTADEIRERYGKGKR